MFHSGTRDAMNGFAGSAPLEPWHVSRVERLEISLIAHGAVLARHVLFYSSAKKRFGAAGKKLLLQIDPIH